MKIKTIKEYIKNSSLNKKLNFNGTRKTIKYFHENNKTNISTIARTFISGSILVLCFYSIPIINNYMDKKNSSRNEFTNNTKQKLNLQ